MKRDPVDFHTVRAEHIHTHNRLLNWARWCRSGGRGCSVQPMFKQYRAGYEVPTAMSNPIDSLDGHLLEKHVVALPEKNRTALQWSYVHPYIPVLRVRRVLGLTYAGLSETIDTGLTILKNRLENNAQQKCARQCGNIFNR